MQRPSSHLIDQLISAIDIVEVDETSTVLEVFTGQALAEVPRASVVGADAAVSIARQKQSSWAAWPIRERAEILRRFADLVFENRGDLLDVVQAETGKTRAAALEEVLDVMITARFYAARGPRWLSDHRVAGMVPGLTKATVNYRPKGVVGVIAPWNYPLSLAICDALPALLAGNAVVIKPDSQTPLSALFGQRLLVEAGLPVGVLQCVPGAGQVVGQRLVQTCDYLMFTGSSATGKKLGAQAGGRLIGYSAELGGKNAMIVAAGADLDRVAEIATRAMFSNSGQLCISIERVYVEDEIADEFCAVLRDRIQAMSIGPSYRFGVEMGSLISSAHLKTVETHVADAVAKGAQVLCGGRARPDLGPCFYEPTLLIDVPESATCYREETFGPVVSIYRVADVDEAVARANDTRYGLNASVFAASARAGQAIARRLNAGTANVNEGYAPAWGSLGGPMGGMGDSGVGRRHGREGLLKYTEAQTLAVQRLVHLGGPSFIDPEIWPEVLAKATNLMRFLPGR